MPEVVEGLTIITRPTDRPAPRRLPSWLKRPLPRGNADSFTEKLLGELRLETVCENARCPNRPECYAHKTATFMILGNVCTRPCGFCAVPRGKPLEVSDDEPDRVAAAAAQLGLMHVVITSVTRDDLPDGGATHFYRTILAVRQRSGAVVEVLTPDFRGNKAAIDRVLEARPDVFNHNLETVPRLYSRVRRNADYRRSLDVLDYVKGRDSSVMTKSGIMLGLGETREEVLQVFADLRAIYCDMLTVGQYLQPSVGHLPVERFVPPEEFGELGNLARDLGFGRVASGPFVRSSYHAAELMD